MADKIHRNSLKPGYKLHWYRVESILGQGGFGLTYLVYDFNLDQQAAIKEYLPIELAVRERDFSVHPVSEDTGEKFKWGLDRFMLEARTLARFKHPNIVRVLNVFEANNTAYMVMEYEHGESLQELLTRRRTLEEVELTNLLLPVLGGLQKVHESGFIHRDVKPGNIFLRKDGSPVLLDFGSARQALGVATQTLTSLVSPGYAPFEQYHSKSDQQGPWTDIYGLGATFYRAIAGVAPMDSVDRSRAILKTGRDVLVPAVAIGKGRYSERFLRAVDHALQFKEEDRPQNIEEWRREFSVAGSSVTFLRPTTSEAPTVQPEAITGRGRSDSSDPVDAEDGEVSGRSERSDPVRGAPARSPASLVIGMIALGILLAGTGVGYNYWRSEHARVQSAQQRSAADLRADAASFVDELLGDTPQQRTVADQRAAEAETAIAAGDLETARRKLAEAAAADADAPSLAAARVKADDAAKARDERINSLLREAEEAAGSEDGQTVATRLEEAEKLGGETRVIRSLRDRLRVGTERKAAAAFAESKDALAAKDTPRARAALARATRLKQQADFLAAKTQQGSERQLRPRLESEKKQ